MHINGATLMCRKGLLPTDKGRLPTAGGQHSQPPGGNVPPLPLGEGWGEGCLMCAKPPHPNPLPKGEGTTMTAKNKKRPNEDEGR